MVRFLDFLVRCKSAESPKELNWEAVAEVLAARAALLDENDLFLIGFCSSRQPALGSDYPGLVVGNVPSIFLPDEGQSFQISFMGPLPGEVGDEQFFAAWATVGFQPFRHKGDLSYSRGHMSLLETAGAIREALAVISSIYGDDKVCYLEVLGDKTLQKMLAGSREFRESGIFRFEIPKRP